MPRYIVVVFKFVCFFEILFFSKKKAIYHVLEIRVLCRTVAQQAKPVVRATKARARVRATSVWPTRVCVARVKTG